MRSAQGRGGGTEFDSLREYTVDDEFRRIDWPATARSGRTMAGRGAGVPRLEWGMDAAMMLAAVAGRLGDRCGLVAFDREVTKVVAPAGGTAQLTRVMSALYDLEPQLVESDYRGAFATTLARFRRRALLVLVTELTEEAVAETLIPELPLLLGRHLVVVASVADPDVVGWAWRPPGEPATAFRSAAAMGALERRAATAARLRALGATVVDAPPHEVAPRLADAYLRVKATGRL